MANYWKPVMLGDIVESALRRVGITKKLFGRGCGCGKRQDRLNLWGVRLQHRIHKSRAWWRPYAVAVFKAIGRLA